MRLSKLINIGAVLESDLMSIGINTKEELKECGSINALIRLSKHYEVCINQLYALEGAVQNIRWHDLSAEVKEGLKQQYNELYDKGEFNKI